ncbi:MAG: ATP-dependent RecD-like DNA helicase [Desulfovibrionaceae bacterium]|nr:ATP-dependent RecD-like DNA helicase [Desulfovibrionaceae bacterium]
MTNPFRQERIRGQLERVTYTNEENGYTVARVKVANRDDLITIVGNIVNPTPGEILEMTGEWSLHAKFGEQFKVLSYQSVVPASLSGIEKYLGSGLIKGIGPKMAKRIVKLFGDKTLEVIEATPERLSEVPGIGEQRVDMIKVAWEEQKEVREVMVFLQGYGVSTIYATKIFKVYGRDAIKIVQENPYRLAYDIFGIGFLTADKTAQRLGFDLDSPLRLEAGVLYVLSNLADSGHIFYPLEPLVVKALELLQIQNPELVRGAVGRLQLEQRVTLDKVEIEGQENQAVYLGGFFHAEVKVAQFVANLLRFPADIMPLNADKALALAENQCQITLAPKQREAVRAALREKVLIITGGPGTGKSTILDVILRIFGPHTSKICLAAPTGRAAKRMSEVTGLEAKTIHRLLCYDFKTHSFRKQEKDPLDCELLILDEVSMVDLMLFYYLLKALPPTSKLILVGDTNQLPSVGAGSVLHDLIRSGHVPVVRLTEIFRQAQTSCIVTNAHKIIQGKNLFFSNQERDDMFFINEEDPEKIVHTIVGLVKDRLPRKYGYDPFNDIQVLSPMNRGVVGTANFNVALQQALNPKGMQVERGNRIFRVGDKVMQIKNNYDKEVFNGDIGIIKKIDSEEQTVQVSIDGNLVSYEFNDLDELVLAYAISIHKSQGAEYPCVIIPVSTQHYVMLQRNLLYTGVTRGKKIVVLVGTQKALNIAIHNNKQMYRYTYLDARIKRQLKP